MATMETRAATLLSQSLERMTGVKLPVNPEGLTFGTQAHHAILVGSRAVEAGAISRSELAAVKYDGYIVHVRDDGIAVAGYRDVGTLYGAYALLEKLGCGFYAPSCEVIPKLDKTQVEDFSISSRPAMEFRSGGYYGCGESVSDIGDPCKAANPELFTPEAGSNLRSAPRVLRPA